WEPHAETPNSKLQTSKPAGIANGESKIEKKEGKVVEAKSLKRVMAMIGVPPDFEQMAKTAGNPLRWIHRREYGRDTRSKIGAPVSDPARSIEQNRAGSE